MADPDEGELTALLSYAHSVSEPEIGVSNHPEDVGDSPVDHGFDHDV